MSTVAELVESRELLTNLTLRELRGKYKRSVLGWTWSLLNPLALTGIYTLLFKFFLKIGTPIGHDGLAVFALWLLCGLLAWNYTSNGMIGGMSTLVANGALVKKVWFPRELLVVSSVASWAYSYLIELGTLCLVLLGFGNFVVPWLVPVLVLVAIQTVFVIGVALLLSVLNVYFRDVQHFLGIFMQLWFYATPVIYPISRVPQAGHIGGVRIPVRAIYDLNPMVRFVEAYRDVLYRLTFPPIGDLLLLTVGSFATLALGWAVFRKLETRLAEEL